MSDNRLTVDKVRLIKKVKSQTNCNFRLYCILLLIKKLEDIFQLVASKSQSGIYFSYNDEKILWIGEFYKKGCISQVLKVPNVPKKHVRNYHYIKKINFNFCENSQIARILTSGAPKDSIELEFKDNFFNFLSDMMSPESIAEVMLNIIINIIENKKNIKIK